MGNYKKESNQHLPLFYNVVCLKQGDCTRERHLIVCCTDGGRQRTESFLFAGLPQHLVHF